MIDYLALIDKYYGDKPELRHILVTHSRQVADRVLFIDQGIIAEEGAPDEVFGNPQNPRTKSFLEKVLEA